MRTYLQQRITIGQLDSFSIQRYGQYIGYGKNAWPWKTTKTRNTCKSVFSYINPKGQEISKANFLETPLPKEQIKMDQMKNNNISLY